MTRTLAVVVGVGKYRAPLISDLPGCASDGRRVQQSLIAWGVLRENIKLLLDEEATRKNVLHALRVWPLEIPDPALRMLFFFSGHGRRICESGRPDRSVLLTHDTEVSDMAGTALTLTDLMAAFGRIRPRESYLFLDACELRIDTLEDILPDADVLSTSGSASMFCLVAAGLRAAAERVSPPLGCFTDSVLANMAHLRQTRATCSELAKVGDHAGLAVAWGNLGEIMWKAGEYHDASVQLSIGYREACNVDGPALKIEIARNMVHVELRNGGPFAPGLDSALDLMFGLLRDDMGKTVGMQLWNTAATVAAYRCDSSWLKDCLTHAEAYTLGNSEYDIYTMANRAIAFALDDDVKNAVDNLREALALARAGANILALRQISDDVAFICRKCRTHAMEELFCLTSSLLYHPQTGNVHGPED